MRIQYRDATASSFSSSVIRAIMACDIGDRPWRSASGVFDAVMLRPNTGGAYWHGGSGLAVKVSGKLGSLAQPRLALTRAPQRPRCSLRLRSPNHQDSP